MQIIEATGLTKTYQSKTGPVHALAGLDLTVPRGTVKALLGPNGAGKTTVVKMLTTLIRPDSGRAFVDGIDVAADPKGVRRIIGVSGQYAAVDENLTGFENLEMVGRLYHLGGAVARRRAQELIDLFELTAAGNRPVKGFSGGMRRRIDLAGALVMNPKVLFLDEPTTGLDPRSRIALWEVIKRLVADGTTVLLTTQYLEEADQLSDDIMVIDDGRVIAEGTSDQLKAQIGGHRLVIALVDAAHSAAAQHIMARHGAGTLSVSTDRRGVEVAVTDGPLGLQRVLADLGAANIDLHDAGMRRPTLDDVFLKLTGHKADLSQDADTDAVTPKKGRSGRSHTDSTDASDGSGTAAEPREHAR